MAKTKETDHFLYNSLKNIRTRCNNPNNPRYKDYGGRGIECRFESVFDLAKELGPMPSPQHTIDRIDNDGHYEIGNVRWATAKEQAENKRGPEVTNNQLHALKFIFNWIRKNGKYPSIGDYAKEAKIDRTNAKVRIIGLCKKGFAVHTEPIKDQASLTQKGISLLDKELKK